MALVHGYTLASHDQAAQASSNTLPVIGKVAIIAPRADRAHRVLRAITASSVDDISWVATVALVLLSPIGTSPLPPSNT